MFIFYAVHIVHSVFQRPAQKVWKCTRKNLKIQEKPQEKIHRNLNNPPA